MIGLTRGARDERAWLSLSVVAALRKEPDIAIGNVLGSNIFNVLCVMGLTTLVSPHPMIVPRDVDAGRVGDAGRLWRASR